MTSGFRHSAVFILLLGLAVTFFTTFSRAQQDAADKPSAAQQSTSSDAKLPDAPSATQSQKDSQGPNGTKKGTGTSNDRLFLALPNFLTLENAGNVPPLTSGQKFKAVARGAFDKVQFVWYGLLAGVSQAENSEPGFGQGAQGYGKRYGAAFADGAIENFMTGAVMPSILHQDPRFFQQSAGTFTHRAEYAASRIFITRSDAGKRQFNFSEIFGSALSAGISTNTYHPRAFITKKFDPTTNMIVYIHNASDRTLPNTLSVWGSQVGYDTLTLVIKEFWPDVHRKMTHKHNQEVQAGSTAP
jgi:hypothetical protein